MRIILIGQAPFGAMTLETLLGAGENVVAVYTPPDKQGARTDPLKETALNKGLPVFQPKTYKDERTFGEFEELKPDLVILAFVTAIIPQRYFDAATRGAICYHPSILPRHRGASAINWAIIMGDTRTGLSIFRPDAGIDTGPILVQKEIDIGPNDTAGSLYFDRLFPMGVEAIVETARLIREGKVVETAQDESLATYEPPCDDAVAGIDWNKTGEEIHNLIRGCDPQPGAYAGFHGEKVRLYNATFIRGSIGGDIEVESGTVSGLDLKGIRIAAPGGELLVARVRAASVGKMEAVDWAAGMNIKPGDRFERFGS